MPRCWNGSWSGLVPRRADPENDLAEVVSDAQGHNRTSCLVNDGQDPVVDLPQSGGVNPIGLVRDLALYGVGGT